MIVRINYISQGYRNQRIFIGIIIEIGNTVLHIFLKSKFRKPNKMFILHQVIRDHTPKITKSGNSFLKKGANVNLTEIF